MGQQLGIFWRARDLLFHKLFDLRVGHVIRIICEILAVLLSHTGLLTLFSTSRVVGELVETITKNGFHAKRQRLKARLKEHLKHVLASLFASFASLLEICCSVDDYQHELYTGICSTITCKT